MLRFDLGCRHVTFVAHPLFIGCCVSYLSCDAEEWERGVHN